MGDASDITANPDIDEGTADIRIQTTGLYINLTFGTIITVLCIFLFDILRRNIPSVYEGRRKLNLDGDPLDYMGNRVATPPAPSYRVLGWLLPTLRLDLNTIADTHGLDAALFLRYMQFMLSLFCVLAVSTIFTLPVYLTGPPDTSIRGLNKLSISNAGNDQWRFWIVLVVEYAITIFVFYHMRRQLELYSIYRRRYRASSHPANYAIVVQDIPSDYRSEKTVHDYWNFIFPDEIAAVFFVQDARRLEKHKEQFWYTVDKRERAEHKQYRQEQKKLRKRQRKGEQIDSNPKSLHSDPDTVDTSGNCFGQCAPRDATHAVAYWRERQNRHYAKVVAHQTRKEEGSYPLTRSAIVVFNNRRAASVAAQTNFARTEHEWRVERAPEPEAINWGALCVTGWTIYIRQMITTLLGVSFTMFWVIPITAIMSMVSISNLENLEIGGEKPLAFLKVINDWPQWASSVIQSNLPTVILIIFLSFVPSIFGAFVSISRIISEAHRDMLVRDWYFLFVTFSNFLFVVFAGTLLQEMTRIIKKPAEVIDILAKSIPKQAAFMVNFIILTALTETPRELLQLFRIAIRWFKLKFLAKTERQRSEADTGDMEMDYVGFYATGQLVTLLGLVYCTIQPLIIYACMIYFGINFVVLKYNLCYAFYNEYQDGGRMFGGAIYSVWVGLFVHLLTMIGVLGLNKTPSQSVLIIIPAVGAVLFLLHCRKTYSRVFEHGSALETQDRLEAFEGTGGVDSIPKERAELYIHPGFEELPALDKLENLNGVPTKDDMDGNGSSGPSDQESSSVETNDKTKTGKHVENGQGVAREEVTLPVEGMWGEEDRAKGEQDTGGREQDEFESAVNVELGMEDKRQEKDVESNVGSASYVVSDQAMNVGSNAP